MYKSYSEWYRQMRRDEVKRNARRLAQAHPTNVQLEVFAGPMERFFRATPNSTTK